MNVLVTGASGALGRATVELFRARGHAVFPVDRGAGFDLTRADDALRAYEAAEVAMGAVTTVVNLAGGFRFAALSDGVEAWQAMYAANLATCLNMCAVAAARLPAGGAIVNVGAAAATRAGAGMGAYAASKAAVARLTESLAEELAGRVRVNAVLPRTMDTPQNRRDMPDVDPARWTATGAVAEAILFLASDQARAVNGALLETTNPSA